MGYYPLMFEVSRYPVVLVGGGQEAEHKLLSLLEAEASLTVFAPTLTPTMAKSLRRSQASWERRPVVAEDFDGVRLVFAASDDPTYNRKVAQMARERGAWVNTVDDPNFCDVVATSHFRRGPLLVSIFSGGKAPGVAKVLRTRLETIIDETWSDLIEQVAALRSQLRQTTPSFSERRQRLADYVQAHLPPLFQTPILDPGTVALVGAGPGSVDLLTVGALKALSHAEVVLHDRLVHPSVLDLAPKHARRIDVGKVPGVGHPTQEDIHHQLIDWARAGYRVVRLHGGDPFVFGRAGEEILALSAAGIRFSMIPGLSSALAAPALAQIPVTLRRMADQVAVVSARTSSGSVDWTWMRRFSGTLVVLMGMATLEQVVDEITATGRPLDTPAAVISWAGWEQQAILRAPLGELAARVRRHPLPSPAVIVIGAVVNAIESKLNSDATPKTSPS